MEHQSCRVEGHPHRVGLAVLACVQNALLGGALYGWASIDRGLLAAPKDQGGAGLSLRETTQIFSLASSTSMVATLVLGTVLDRYGPRICSIVAHISIATGFQLFSIADSYELYILATCLIAFGGPGISVSIVHVSNLFTGNQFLVLSGLTGSVTMSFAIFTAFDWIWENSQRRSVGVDVHFLFGSSVLVVMASLLASWLFWPNASFEAPEKDCQGVWEPTPEEEYVEATTAHQHLLEQPLGSFLRSETDRRISRSVSFQMSRKALRRGDGTLLSIKDQPFFRQLISATYIRSLLLLFVTNFLANFYVASFSTEVADSQYYSTEEQHQLARSLTLIMSSGVLASFLVGWLMDRLNREICTVCALLLGQTQLVVLLFVGKRRPWIITSFVFYGFFRQFLFPCFIANLTDDLGFKYFGLLNGIAFAISGLPQVCMASLVAIVQGNCHLVEPLEPGSVSNDCFRGYWMQLHEAEVVILGMLLLGPILQYRDRVRRESQRTRFSLDSPTSFNYGSVQMHEQLDL